VIITPEEALDALEDVIYSLESFDVTTIRASTRKLWWLELEGLGA